MGGPAPVQFGGRPTQDDLPWFLPPVAVELHAQMDVSKGLERPLDPEELEVLVPLVDPIRLEDPPLAQSVGNDEMSVPREIPDFHKSGRGGDAIKIWSGCRPRTTRTLRWRQALSHTRDSTVRCRRGGRSPASPWRRGRPAPRARPSRNSSPTSGRHCSGPSPP